MGFEQSIVCRPLWEERYRRDLHVSERRMHVSVSYAIHETTGPFGDRRTRLSNLAIDKSSIQKDILEGELGIIDITNGDRGEIKHESDLIRNQWG